MRGKICTGGGRVSLARARPVPRLCKSSPRGGYTAMEPRSENSPRSRLRYGKRARGPRGPAWARAGVRCCPVRPRTDHRVAARIDQTTAAALCPAASVGLARLGREGDARGTPTIEMSRRRRDRHRRRFHELHDAAGQARRHAAVSARRSSPRDPLAWPKLWKHHGARTQADRINEVARERGEAFLERYGGTIGLEWFFPKVLETLEGAPHVYRRRRRLARGRRLVRLATGRRRGRRAAALDVPGRLQRDVERDGRLPVGGLPRGRASQAGGRRARARCPDDSSRPATRPAD